MNREMHERLQGLLERLDQLSGLLPVNGPARDAFGRAAGRLFKQRTSPLFGDKFATERHREWFAEGVSESAAAHGGSSNTLAARIMDDAQAELAAAEQLVAG